MRRREPRSDESQRLGDENERVRHVPTSGCRESEHEGDDDVLEDEDGEDEVGLVVTQAAEVDEPLHRDRARGDVHARREDERSEREAEGCHADDQPEPEVRNEVDRAAETEVAAAPAESRQRELEPEEEEQEDDAELGDELRHLGLTDQRQLLGLVRAEQETCEQIGRDRRQPDSASDEAEHAQHGDGYGELGEGHGCILPPRAESLLPRAGRPFGDGREQRARLLQRGDAKATTHTTAAPSEKMPSARTSAVPTSRNPALSMFSWCAGDCSHNATASRGLAASGDAVMRFSAKRACR